MLRTKKLIRKWIARVLKFELIFNIKFIKTIQNQYFLYDLYCMQNQQSFHLPQYIDYLTNNRDFFRSRSIIKYLASLYEYTLTSINSNSELNVSSEVTNQNFKGKYIAHIPVWGKSYSDKMLNYFLPSLLSPNNLPKVSSDYQILLYIHCDLETRTRLTTAPVIYEISKFAQIQYEIIPDNVMANMREATNSLIIQMFGLTQSLENTWKYSTLGCLQNIAMLKALNNEALISFFMPDLIFSDGALTKFFSAIESGRVCAVATAFRSKFTHVKDQISEYYKGLYLDIPASMLSQLILENMHPSAQNRIVSSKNKNFQITPQMIFSYADALVLRSLHYHPFLVDFSKISRQISYDLKPIDASLLNNIVNPNLSLNEQLWINNDSEYLAIMEMSEDNVENIEKYPPNWEIHDLVTYFISSHQWTNVNRFLLKNRYVYKVRTHNNNLLSDYLDTHLIPTI